MADPTSKKPDVKERRKHRRFGAMGPVDLTVQGEEPQEAYLAGIGRGGLGVYLHREVRPGQLVVLSLRLIEKGREGEALKIAARIRWVRPAGWFYMAGMEFEKMSDERYRMLLRHLNLIEALQS